MKKGGILNPAICSLLAELGHLDELLIVDAGYPLPPDGHVIDLTLTPGQFARLRVDLGTPASVLLVPAAAVVPDQSKQMVMTVAADGTVVPKIVELGELDHGLRVVRSGLAASDRVIINGLVRARPRMKVTPVAGTIKPDTTGVDS